jgi:hypothetical protein
MVVNIKVGDRVMGVTSKVLQKGDYNKKDAKKTIEGTVQSMIGTGRSRKWSVKWDDPQKTTEVGARSLTKHSTTTNGTDTEESSSSSSEDSSGASSDHGQVSKQPTVAPAPSDLDPHGLHWEQVTEVSVDTFSQPRRNFLLKWPNDLPQENRQPIHYFFLLFPTTSMSKFMEYTNIELQGASQKLLTKHEFYKFLGMIYAFTLVDYAKRSDYWGESTRLELFPKPNFGRFGIGQNRFETILRYLRCAPAGSDDRWCHIRAFVDSFNLNRQSVVEPSWILCVDEKTSSFRPRKGAYLPDGPPTITKIIRKPKSVCLELKDCTDGQSRVTLRLELQEGKEAMSTKEYTDTYNAGTSIVLRLTKPWFNTGRLIVGDSAFASVECAIACHEKGLEFTGLVKTASRKFPKKFLEQLDLPVKGDHAVCISNPKSTLRLIAVAWNGGKKRKLLVSTCGVTRLAADNAMRERYRDRGDGTSELVKKETPWPQLVANYFHAACASDVNNHYRQSSLAVEESWGTHNWWHRVFATVLGTIEADAYLAYLYSHPSQKKLSHREFIEEIAHGLIFNDFEGAINDESGRKRKRQSGQPDEEALDTHTLEKVSSLAKVDHVNPNHRSQKTCKVCHKKCSYYCVECTQMKKRGIFGVCGPGSERGMQCYIEHPDI